MEPILDPKKLDDETLKLRLNRNSVIENKLAEEINCLEIRLAFRREQHESLTQEIEAFKQALLERTA